jgi:hypothetical protein
MELMTEKSDHHVNSSERTMAQRRLDRARLSLGETEPDGRLVALLHGNSNLASPTIANPPVSRTV